ncbi:tetratricopeptide repeat protein [Herminiimonas glaciei]|uniref:Tetratricopeptide repeat protein n=1 Tax=Herminiimonas glaciei TaxID=523788 RepID=A0ABW2IA57_9BURK
MRTLLIYLCLCSLTTSTWAQNLATSSGANSPAINAAPGSKVGIEYLTQVTNYYISPAEKIGAATKNEKDPSFIRANHFVSKGDYKNALKELERFTANKNHAARKLALAKYIEAQIYSYNERFDRADKSFSTALDLEPNNCTYLFSKGHSLMNIGKLWEAERLLSDEQGGTASCLASGTPAEIANLHLVSARIHLELRDRASTYDDMDKAYRAIKQSKNYSGWAEPTCVLFDLIKSVPTVDQSRWPDLLTSCVNKMQQQTNNKNSLITERAIFYEALHQNSPTALGIGTALRSEWTDAEALDIAGVDVVKKRALRGTFLSDLGMQAFWTGGDPASAGELYREAYNVLEPLISSGRNTIIAETMGLMLRVMHLDTMASPYVFPDAAPRFAKAIRLSRKYAYLDGSFQSCFTLDLINRASQGIPEIAASASDISQADACFKRALTPGSWTAVKNNFDNVSESTAKDVTEASLRQRIEARKALFGFPSNTRIYADQASDLVLLAIMVKQSLGANSPEYVDIANQALLEAAKEPSLKRSTFVISKLAADSTLPFPIRNNLVRLAFAQVNENSSRPDNDMHQCHFGGRSTEMTAEILAFAIKYDQTDLSAPASVLWKRGMKVIDQCLEQPPKSERLSDQHHDHLQKLQFDFIVTQVSLGAHEAKVDPLCQLLPVCKSLKQFPNQRELLRSTIGK